MTRFSKILVGCCALALTVTALGGCSKSDNSSDYLSEIIVETGDVPVKKTNPTFKTTAAGDGGSAQGSDSGNNDKTDAKKTEKTGAVSNRGSDNLAITPSDPANGGTLKLANDTMRSFLTGSYSLGCCKDYVTTGDRQALNTVSLNWECLEIPSSFEVLVSTSSNLSNPVTLTCNGFRNDVVFPNPLVNTTYYWQIKALFKENTITSPVYSFKTEATVRTIGSTGNIRDLGGYNTSFGKTVKQNMIIRGSVPDTPVLTILENVSVTTELDMRDEEKDVHHPFTRGKMIPGASKYSYLPGAQYWSNSALTNGIDTGYVNNLVKAVKLFADQSNYPIYFHCYSGLDRTGTLACILEALLGVSKDDIYRDYELSYLSAEGSAAYNNSFQSKLSQFDTLYNTILAYDSSNMASATEKFLIEKGVTKAEIDAIRSIMLG